MPAAAPPAVPTPRAVLPPAADLAPVAPAVVNIEQRADPLGDLLATSVLARKKTLTTVAESSKASLKASIGGKTAADVKEAT